MFGASDLRQPSRDGSQQLFTEQELRAEVAALAPFHHAIDLPYGINTYDPAYRASARQSAGRIDTMRRHLWPVLLDLFGGNLAGKRILDVACNCGGFSFLAAQSGATEVLGVDSEISYINQARFLKRALQDEKVEFQQVRLEDLTPEIHGEFDITFFFGILYHVENPIEALRRIANLTRDTIVIDTSLMRLPYIDRFIRRAMWTMKLVSPISHRDTTTGLWRKGRHCQFYPNKIAVLEAFGLVGFDQANYLVPAVQGLEPRYYKHTRGVFIGRKGGRAPALA